MLNAGSTSDDVILFDYQNSKVLDCTKMASVAVSLRFNGCVVFMCVVFIRLAIQTVYRPSWRWLGCKILACCCVEHLTETQSCTSYRYATTTVHTLTHS